MVTRTTGQDVFGRLQRSPCKNCNFLVTFSFTVYFVFMRIYKETPITKGHTAETKDTEQRFKAALQIVFATMLFYDCKICFNIHCLRNVLKI